MTAVRNGAAAGCASETLVTGPIRFAKNDFEITHEANLGAIPVSMSTPANTWIIPITANVTSSGLTPLSTGAQESGLKAQSARPTPIAAIVLRPEFLIAHPLR